MSRQDFAADWVPFRDPILSTYPELTDADLEDADGSAEALARTIAEKQGAELGETKERLDAFLAGPMPADAYAAPVHDNAAVMESADDIQAGEDVSDDDRRFGDDATAETPMGRAL